MSGVPRRADTKGVQRWTTRAATLGALAVAALFGAVVSSHAGVAPASGAAPNGFSGPVSAGQHARPLDTDLESGSAALHQVHCAVAAATTACFAAS